MTKTSLKRTFIPEGARINRRDIAERVVKHFKCVLNAHIKDEPAFTTHVFSELPNTLCQKYANALLEDRALNEDFIIDALLNDARTPIIKNFILYLRKNDPEAIHPVIQAQYKADTDRYAKYY